MDGALHAVGIGIADQIVEFLLGEHAETPGIGCICVRLGQICGSGTQSAVTQHFQRADPEKIRSGTGAISAFCKFCQCFSICEIGLFIDPDG